MDCFEDPSHQHCVDLGYDDNKCGALYERCACINDPYWHGKCMAQLRGCRRLGNAWDAIRPLRPMDAHAFGTDRPGYDTQGLLREGFGSATDVQCFVRNAGCSLLVGLLYRWLLGTKVGTKRLVVYALLASAIQCALKQF